MTWETNPFLQVGFYIPRRGMYIPRRGMYVSRRGIYIPRRGIYFMPPYFSLSIASWRFGTTQRFVRIFPAFYCCHILISSYWCLLNGFKCNIYGILPVDKPHLQ